MHMISWKTVGRWVHGVLLAAATLLRPTSMLLVMLMLASCAYGVRPTPDSSPPPNISIPPGQTLPAKQLPQPAGNDSASLLENHVEVARLYYGLSDRFVSLVCTITSATGITIDGAKPSPPPYCAREPPAGQDVAGRGGSSQDDRS